MTDAESTTDQLESNAEQPQMEFDVYCHECGYNLRGIVTTRCPECGTGSPALQNAKPSIPWAHRESLGNVRAFIRTVLFASFGLRKLSQNVYLPIDFAESQKFRRWTIGTTMLFAIAFVVWFQVSGVSGLLSNSFFTDLRGMIWPSVVIVCLLALYVVLATGVPSLFFDYRDVPVSLRNNAVALSYYYAAPLAWWPIPLAISVLIILQNPIDMRTRWLAVTLTSIAFFAPLTPIVLWCFQLFRIAKRVLRGQTGRKVWLTIGIPLLWFACAILVFLLIPLAGFYTWVLVDALS